MRDIDKLGECDLSSIDLRAITPAERDAVKREAIRRARVLRAKMIHDVVNRPWVKTLLVAPAIACACLASSAFADVIADWDEKGVALVTPRLSPPATERAMAMVHVAMFDAVNSIERRYRPYLVQ